MRSFAVYIFYHLLLYLLRLPTPPAARAPVYLPRYVPPRAPLPFAARCLCHHRALTPLPVALLRRSTVYYLLVRSFAAVDVPPCCCWCHLPSCHAGRRTLQLRYITTMYRTVYPTGLNVQFVLVTLLRYFTIPVHYHCMTLPDIERHR